MNKCPFCEESELLSAHLDMKRCSSCKLFIKSKPVPKQHLKEHLKDFLLSACWREESYIDRMNDAEHQMKCLHTFSAPGKLYDVGAASGFFMKKAREYGWDVSGNDISAAGVKFAKENFQLAIDHEFFEDVGLESSTYDAVVMWNTLEHTHNPSHTVFEAKRILKKGGLLFIKVPEMPTLELLKVYYDPYHFFEFNVKNLSNFLSQNGFKQLMVNKLWKRYELSATEYLFEKE
jgi:2-polyprenyl-3-methyl-5-hydroxy-6-metoxy-1,4-benzoquinol methylase